MENIYIIYVCVQGGMELVSKNWKKLNIFLSFFKTYFDKNIFKNDKNIY